MTVYNLRSAERLERCHPLHWRNFYPDKQRIHRDLMRQRQNLILYLANLHANAVSSGMPLGMIEIRISLTALRDLVHDYRIAVDHFFEVRQLGFNISETQHQLSTLVPKNITSVAKAASNAALNLEYEPPQRDGDVASKVYVRRENGPAILDKLRATNRLDLIVPVRWLLKQGEINVQFQRAGKLKLRDTSIWPVPGLETWPSWLRRDLFGGGIDIDAAYTQFLVQSLREAHQNDELVRLIYPDLVAQLERKAEWRAQLCEDVLGVPPTEDNIGVVKRVCMSLANGSKISPSILVGSRAFSTTSDLVFSAVNDVSIENLTRVGKRLQRIAVQYSNAKKMICSSLRRSSTRLNQRQVFAHYFEWEREARYKIWEACDRHGIMVHDGIDGIPAQYLEDTATLSKLLGIQLTAAQIIQH